MNYGDMYVLAVSVMSDVVKSYFGDGKDLDVHIQYTNEKYPMGTAGAIRLAEDYLKDDNFFMLNGDLIMNMPINGSEMKGRRIR